MADEPRRSGRATKGQHTKNSEDDSAAPSKRGKGKKDGKGGESGEEEEEDNAIIRCICGTDKDEDGWAMICCDKCEAWQHNLCMGITELEDDLPEHYFCERCRPQDHRDLLSAMKRGEKPWEVRINKRREAEAEAARNKKKGKGKRKSAGTATPKDTPAKTTPVPEATNKRKFESLESTPAQVRRSTSRITSEVADTSVKAQKSVSPATVVATPVATPSLGRRKSPAQIVVSDAKRRKSTADGAQARKVSTAFPLVESVDDLPQDRRKIVQVLSGKIKPVIDRLVKTNEYRIPDGATAVYLANSEALKIEHALICHYADVSAYGDQFRTILFNVSKNIQLVSRLLSGSLLPEELPDMSADDMASEELQHKRAVMKEEADKQAVLITSTGPRMRKTHKGDEIIGDDTAASRPLDDASWTKQPVRRHRDPEDEAMGDDIGSPDGGHGSEHMVELPEDAAKLPLSLDTHASTRKPSNFDLGRAWNSAHSPDAPHAAFTRQPTTTTQHSPDTQMHDADIDRLLKDEDDDSAPGSPLDTTAAWAGKIDMAGVAAFSASARWVAGGDLGQKMAWSSLIPRRMEITGRIAIARADEYVSNMRFSSTNDVCCLAITPRSSGVDKEAFEKVWRYFFEKERWGVVNQPGLNEAVRDVYVVPLEKGGSAYPEFLGMLDERRIEEPRRENMLLLTLVVKTRSPGSTPQLAQTPIPPLNVGVAPHPSPVVAQSPFGTTPGPPLPPLGGPPGGTQPPPSYPWATPQITAILGREIHAPAVVQLFTAVPDMTEQQVVNLKELLEREPEARQDIGKLAGALQRGVAGG